MNRSPRLVSALALAWLLLAPAGPLGSQEPASTDATDTATVADVVEAAADGVDQGDAAEVEAEPGTSLGDFLRSIAEDIDRLSPDPPEDTVDAEDDEGDSEDETISDPKKRPESKDPKDPESNRNDDSGTVSVAPQITPDGEGERLLLADVIASLYRSYPDILRARQEPQIAAGELTSAYGAFDTKFQAHSLAEPLGFYKNYRNGLGVARQTWWGGYVAAGYRIGRGLFQPWYKERDTDDAGEFKFAFNQPLLQGRAIDPARVAVFQASLAQRAAEPMIQQAILEIAAEASRIYWEWVSAGAVLEAQRELLELAILRGEQFAIGVEAGKFAEIDLILNQQLIADRRAKLLVVEQKFRATSFKLSLYLRDEVGAPLVPSDDWLPQRFPMIQPPPLGNFDADLVAALGRRPEPQILQYELQQVGWDRQLACNQMLPRLDFISEISQDMGEPASKSDDKGEFEMVIGITSEVPIQRRKARGKIRSTSAKMTQINEKIRLVRDKIGTELQTAYNALLLSQQVVEQTEIAFRASLETLDRYRFAFDQGKIDLIYLNLLEVKANETEIKLVEAQRNWFSALAQMQIALGLDPLDQAMAVSAMPPSEMPGPGNLPELDPVEADDFEADWKRKTGQ